MRDGVYIRLDRPVQCGAPSESGGTVQLIPGVVMADYDAAGRLLGVEVLGPATVTVDGRPVNPNRKGDEVAIRPDPTRTHVRARKIDPPAPVPPPEQVGDLSAGVCWEHAGAFGFSCPGCGCRRLIPAEVYADTKQGDIDEIDGLSLLSRVGKCAACKWDGFLLSGMWLTP